MIAHQDRAAKYYVKVCAAQFRVAYCPTLKGLDMHKKNITVHSKN